MHSFKVRFILIFGLFVFISCGIIALLSAKSIYDTAERLFTEQGVTTCEKAASILNGDDFAAFLEDPSEDDPYYEETRLKLLDIKEAVGCRFLYTMAPVSGTEFQYIIDGSCDPSDEENFSALGDTEMLEDMGTDAPAYVMAKGGSKNSGLVHQEEWGWVVSTYRAILTSRGKIVGFVAVDFDGTVIFETLRYEILKISIVGLIFVVLGCVLIYMLSRLVFGKMKEIGAQMENISSGVADLTQRLDESGKNEVSDLARSCNKVIQSIESLTVQLKQEVSVLADNSEILNEKVSQNASNTNDVVENVNTITRRISEQNIRIESLADTMKSVDTDISGLDKMITDQSAAIQNSSSAIEEISSNIRSVDHNVETILGEYGSLVLEATNGRKKLESVSEQIANIAKQSESLSEANSAISSIAEQTNLLAMNAAIEAAHAGDLGKGFGVVADEIRALAETSATQSTAIRELLDGISAAVTHVVASSQQSTESFDSVNQRISRLEGLIKEIQGGMNEERIGMENILYTMKTLDGTTRDITDTSTNIKGESQRAFKSIQELQGLSADIAAGTSEINTRMEGMKDSAAVEARLSEESIQATKHVSDMVNGFTVG